MPPKELDKLETLLKKSAELTRRTFGRYAFRRFVAGNEEEPDGHWEGKVNKGLHDLVMWGFTIYDKHQVTPHVDAIREELINLMVRDSKFLDSISGTGTDSKRKSTQNFRYGKNRLKTSFQYP